LARVQFEEWSSLLDTHRGLLKFFAAHIEGAAGSVDKLTQMAKNGEIAGRDLMNTIVKNGAELERTYASMPRTVETAWNGLLNVLGTYVTETDTASGASAQLAGSIDDLAKQALAMRDDFQSGAARRADHGAVGVPRGRMPCGPTGAVVSPLLVFFGVISLRIDSPLRSRR
jgi:hypothetical protein